MSLRNYVSIVTGGSRGIGRAIAEYLAREGSNLTLIARNKEVLENVCYELANKYNVEVIPVNCDVRHPECARTSIEKTIEKFGKIDVLINNAGTAVRKYFHEHTIDEINEIIDINVKGLIYFTLYTVKYMIKQRWGIIINIASGAGKSGIPELSVYSASKFAVVGFTEAIARELYRFGIKVYAICPGGTDTELHRKLFPEHESSKLLKPEEVAELVMKLIKKGGIPGICYDIYRYY